MKNEVAGEAQRLILGLAFHSPEAAQKEGLNEQFFTIDKNKKILKGIYSLNGNRDEAALVKILEGQVDPSYIYDILSGSMKASAKNIGWYINQEKVRRLRVQLNKLLYEGTKTKGFIDDQKVDFIYSEIRQLESQDKIKTETLDIINLEDVEMEPVRWLWYPVAPFGMVGTVLGNPGVGKTYMLADISAKISAGRELPVYKEKSECIQGKVIYITSEGVPKQILKPRLHAAGANMENIKLIRGIYDEKKNFKILDIGHHLPLLEELISDEKSQRYVLIVIDPIASFVSGRTNLNDTTQARQSLDTVARFAEKMDVAVLVAIHPNKDTTKNTMARAAGSMQMSAAVKTAWLVAEPKEDDPLNKRYLAPYKIQMVQFDKNETLPFYLEKGGFEYNGNLFEDVAKVKWGELTEKCNVEKIISPRIDENLPPAVKVRRWLKSYLQEGGRMRSDCMDAGMEQGFSKDQIQNAAKKLNLEQVPSGFGGAWMWSLPIDED